MDGFERRKEQKKESIRRAALELFQIYGFRKVSMNDIARRAGVSQVTIYNHFGSKETLTRDVMKWYILTLVEKYKGTIEKEIPFREKLEYIVFDKSEIASQFQGESIYIYQSPGGNPVIGSKTGSYRCSHPQSADDQQKHAIYESKP